MKSLFPVIWKLLTEHQFSSILLLHERIPDEYPDITLENSKKKKEETDIYCQFESHDYQNNLFWAWKAKLSFKGMKLTKWIC